MGWLGEEDRLRARRALVRVQGLLGPEAVRVPVLSGGRGPAERITLIPLGDEPVPRADPGPPWPGRLPEPSPAVLLDDPVELLDAEGNPIRVTSRGMLSADPARLTVHGRGERLRWWAGPWPVDERWRTTGQGPVKGVAAPPAPRSCSRTSERFCCATASGAGTSREATSDGRAGARTAPPVR